MYNLHALNSGEAKRMWKDSIKSKWNHKCAYCGSNKEITIDHVIPQSKGGIDTSLNCVACCHSCNKDKGHTQWEEWYKKQSFFTYERMHDILEWITPKKPIPFNTYKRRRNKVY